MKNPEDPQSGTVAEEVVRSQNKTSPVPSGSGDETDVCRRNKPRFKTSAEVPSSIGERMLAYLSPVPQGEVVLSAVGVPVERRVASPSLATSGHCLLSFVFIGLVIAYLIVAIIRFTTSPEVESFLQTSTTGLQASTLSISIQCTNPPFCGSMAVKVNYTNVPGCQQYGTSLLTYPPNQSMTPTPISVPLCLSNDFAFSVTEDALLQVPGIVIDSSALNPGEDDGGAGRPNPTGGTWPIDMTRKGSAIITITSGTMTKIVVLDAGQIKTLMLGRVRTERQTSSSKELLEEHLLPNAVQYEGKRITSWRGTLMIRPEAHATIRRLTRQGSVIEILASVGGAASLLGSLLLLISPLLGLFLNSDRKGKRTVVKPLHDPTVLD